MSVGVAVFVKTPGISPVKTRLAKDIGKEKAEEYYLLFSEVIAKKLSALMESQKQFSSYWAVAEKDVLGSSQHWPEFPHIWQGEGDLGERISCVYAELLRDHEIAVLLGNDTPHLGLDKIVQSEMLLRSQKADYVIGPARDGGFYLFASSKPIDEDIWCEVEYSSDKTLEQLASQLDGTIVYLEEMIDIDNVDDLKEVEESLKTSIQS